MNGDIAFNKAFYKATHNSYSGGTRGSIEKQLYEGVRLIELDIEYVNGTFFVGHDRPGDGVDHDGTNPDKNDLAGWLGLIATWLKAPPKSAPVTLVLDCKSDLSGDAAAYDALNDVVVDRFGGALYKATELADNDGDWPTVTELSGRIVGVLSGDLATRKGYGAAQPLFVESQYSAAEPADGDVKGALFWAADASKPAGVTWAMGGLETGKLVRLWGFSKKNIIDVVNFAATDTPYEAWYVDYAADIHAFDEAKAPPEAGPTVSWGESTRYNNGKSPGVAANGRGFVVEVHKSQNEDTLWCRAGKVDAAGKTISWGPSEKYDKGKSPAVAVDDAGNVVEVHKSQNEDALWCRVGRLDEVEKTVKFGPSNKYDKGVSPAVALDRHGNVVEVHKSQNEDTLWCRVGRLDAAKKEVDFGSSEKYDKGVSPSVALADDGRVVEVHKSQNEDTLWCHVGLLDAVNRTVTFADSRRYDNGINPGVAMRRDGYLLEVHESQNEDTLWCRLGEIDAGGQAVSWGDSQKYDRGLGPSPAVVDGTTVVEVHKSQNEDTLWYRVGKIER